MGNNTITLADLMNHALPTESAELTDANGIFKVERTENGCCLHINSDENCTQFIMSAIANYAQSHNDFDLNLVTVSEPADNEVEGNEVEEISRFEFDEKFTLLNT